MVSLHRQYGRKIECHRGRKLIPPKGKGYAVQRRYLGQHDKDGGSEL
jgi:hypothetical protein